MYKLRKDDSDEKTTKILSIILALTFIFSSMSLISFADDGITRYYFDSIDGDDANSGLSEAEAVKTIAGLKGEVKPGAHFLFRNGGRSTTAVNPAGEHELNFYNNTVINSAEFQLKNMYNATVANNIFVMQDGATFAYDIDNIFRGNKVSNNCYYNVMTPLVDMMSFNTVPGFAGDDVTDINSFVLSKNSPLIGAGIKIDDGLTTDFFGNEITSNNIGCYGGNGVNAEYKAETNIERLVRLIKNVFQTIIHEIMVIFD